MNMRCVFVYESFMSGFGSTLWQVHLYYDAILALYKWIHTKSNILHSCFAGIISGSASCPHVSNNVFQCILVSIGIFIEGSRGQVSRYMSVQITYTLDELFVRKILLYYIVDINCCKICIYTVCTWVGGEYIILIAVIIVNITVSTKRNIYTS